MPSIKYLHACDASAAAVIADTSFFAAASDEGCVLRVYDRTNPGAPVSETDASTFLELDDPDDVEIDVEGGAQLGDRTYWIGSHGRSRKGKERKNRQRLFATTIERTGGRVVLRPSGKPYKRLLSDLFNAPALAAFDLATAAEKAPEAEGGFNIEGLAATPDGHLLIGFRNPIPGGKALIAELSNPVAVVDGSAARAQLTLGGTLDLQGRGIRALEFVPQLGLYLVLAGAFNDEGNFRLYAWTGKPDAPARPLATDLGGLNPEELILINSTDSHIELQLLSDDGTDECKSAAPTARSFRGLTVRVPLGVTSRSAL
jgi:hypothetical protein